ncbi:MAG: hypothetical protein IKD76_04615 [Clostridia bacterium]|nr:hypothetical protein [Clostridia bacterium]
MDTFKYTDWPKIKRSSKKECFFDSDDFIPKDVLACYRRFSKLLLEGQIRIGDYKKDKWYGGFPGLHFSESRCSSERWDKLTNETKYLIVFLYKNQYSGKNPEKYLVKMKKFLDVYSDYGQVVKWLYSSYMKALIDCGQYNSDFFKKYMSLFDDDEMRDDVLYGIVPDLYAKAEKLSEDTYIDPHYFTIFVSRKTLKTFISKQLSNYSDDIIRYTEEALEEIRQATNKNFYYCFFKPTIYGVGKFATERRTPDRDAIKSLIRYSENIYRIKHDLPPVGEGWISESLLYHQIKSAFPKTVVEQHSRPNFLGMQHYDVYIPEYKIALEFQGDQHFTPIEVFGGEDALARRKALDEKKREISAKNGVKQIDVIPGYSIRNLLNTIVKYTDNKIEVSNDFDASTELYEYNKHESTKPIDVKKIFDKSKQKEEIHNSIYKFISKYRKDYPIKTSDDFYKYRDLQMRCVLGYGSIDAADSGENIESFEKINDAREKIEYITIKILENGEDFQIGYGLWQNRLFWLNKLYDLIKKEDIDIDSIRLDPEIIIKKSNYNYLLSVKPGGKNNKQETTEKLLKLLLQPSDAYFLYHGINMLDTGTQKPIKMSRLEDEMKSLYNLEKEELLEKAEYMIFEYAAYDDTELGKECRNGKKKYKEFLKTIIMNRGKTLIYLRMILLQYLRRLMTFI